MPRKTHWTFPDGTTVTASEVRLWCQTVGRNVIRIHHRDFWSHVRIWGIVPKVAHHKRNGTFTAVVNQAAADAGITLRKPRTPGTLTRLRQTWHTSANDERLHQEPFAR